MSSVQTSFDRYAVLKVFARSTSTDATTGAPALLDVDKTGTAFPSRFPDGSTGFRIRGKVDKIAAVTSATPNPITVEIYNLGPDSRALVSKTNNLIILEAGYGKSAQQIFTGNVLWGKTTKQGPDYVTEIQAADGLFAFQNARVDQSFQKGISTNQVIKTLVGALSGSGIGPGQVQGVPDGGYNQGIVLSGSAVEELKKVCDKNDLQFSIQDGNVLILPYGSDTGQPAQVISPNTGLIGIPEIRAQDATGRANLVSFRMLMNPGLGIFQKVVLQSKFVNGIYTTAKISHDFDTFEGPFFTEVECS